MDWKGIIDRAAEIVEGYDTLVTLRQLHYRLVAEATGGYTNTQGAYKRLSELTAKARREGAFPSLTDLTRSIVVPSSWASPQDALDEMADMYRRDRTEGQEIVPVIVTEKATLTAQVYSWFGHPFGIMVVPLRGYSSQSFDQVVLDALDPKRSYRVLYVGDHDPSGHDIERHNQQEIGYVISDWERVALTPEIVDAYGLPVALGKDTDSRAARFVAQHGELVQVEVEALDPDDLRALIQASLDTTWDDDAYAAAMKREKAEIEKLRKVVL